MQWFEFGACSTKVMINIVDRYVYNSHSSIWDHRWVSYSFSYNKRYWGLHHNWDIHIAFVFDGSDGVRSYLQKLKGVFIWVLLFVEASWNSFLNGVCILYVVDLACPTTLGVTPLNCRVIVERDKELELESFIFLLCNG